MTEYPDSRSQPNRENMPSESFKFQSKSRLVLQNFHPHLFKDNYTARMIAIIAIIVNMNDAKPHI